MKTIYPIRVQAPGQLENHGDVKLVVTGEAVYYLRCYSDGTFDVFAHERDNTIKAIAGIGFDGAVAGSSLAARLDRFARDNSLHV